MQLLQSKWSQHYTESCIWKSLLPILKNKVVHEIPSHVKKAWRLKAPESRYKIVRFFSATLLSSVLHLLNQDILQKYCIHYTPQI